MTSPLFNRVPTDDEKRLFIQRWGGFLPTRVALAMLLSIFIGVVFGYSGFAIFNGPVLTTVAFTILCLLAIGVGLEVALLIGLLVYCVWFDPYRDEFNWRWTVEKQYRLTRTSLATIFRRWNKATEDGGWEFDPAESANDIADRQAETFARFADEIEREQAR